MSRSEAYIGVLIDDLITKGTDEPYRMFTSRAEYRLLLRQDNADLRLTDKGYQLGLATAERYETVMKKEESVRYLSNDLSQKRLKPAEVNDALADLDNPPLRESTTLNQLLKRPQMDIHKLGYLHNDIAAYLNKYSDEELEQAEIQIKYRDYIERERRNSEKLEALDHQKINPSFDYNKIPALSSEAREKLLSIKPATLGQASRISGVSPADVSVLMVYLGR